MTMTACFCEIDSPVGRIYLRGDGDFLTGLYLPNHKHWSGLDRTARRSDSAFKVARQQLAEYFAGRRQQFDIPIKLAGTSFQQRVWRELEKIPFGVTISYVELARRVGQPNAVRAVGAANGRNPVSIVVPCHRVIASDGKLTGYGGGIENKRKLLDWEHETAGDRSRPLLATAR